MTALDILVLILVAGGAYRGFRAGFVHEMLSLAAWIAGIVALKAFHGPAAAMLADSVGTRAGASALAFALTFGVPFVAVKLLARRVGGAARRSVVGPVDKALGFGFGALKGLIGATLIFLAAHLLTQSAYGATSKRPDWLVGARTYPLLDASSRALVDFVDRRRNAPPKTDAELNG